MNLTQPYNIDTIAADVVGLPTKGSESLLDAIAKFGGTSEPSFLARALSRIRSLWLRPQADLQAMPAVQAVSDDDLGDALEHETRPARWDADAQHD